MALAIDASTPTAVTNAVGTTATVTTGNFTPPVGALLLNLWSGNTEAAINPFTPTITDNLGTPLSYSLQDWQSRADTPTVAGQAADWSAVVGSSVAQTVTVTSGTTSGNRQSALQTVVLTGQHTTPIGAHGKSGSTSASSIAQSYTGTASGSWGFIVVCDWDALGSMTAGTGCTLIATGTIPTTQISWGMFRRTTADGTNGGTTTLNVNLAGTSTHVSWAYAEVVPAASAATANPAQPLVLTTPRYPGGYLSISQMRDVTPIAAIDTPPRTIVVAAPRNRPGPVALTIRPIADPAATPPRASIVAGPTPRWGSALITTRSVADTPIAAGDSPARALVNATPAPRPLAVIITTRMAADAVVAAPDTPPQAFVVATPTRRATTAPIVLRPWVEQVGPDSTLIVVAQPARPRGFLATLATRTDPDAWPTTLIVAAPLRQPATAPILASSRAEPPVVVPGAFMPVAYVIAAPRAHGPGSLFSGQALLVSDCHLPRPDSGDTGRPGAGLTARPTGTTGRPASGLTVRPDTGTTPNPC